MMLEPGPQHRRPYNYVMVLSQWLAMASPRALRSIASDPSGGAYNAPHSVHTTIRLHVPLQTSIMWR